jgi:hypothetical protein
LSLSGLSGVWAGLCALVGAWVVHRETGSIQLSPNDFQYLKYAIEHPESGNSSVKYLFSVAASVVVVAMLGGIFFTTRKARNQGKTVWNVASRRLLWHLALPLLVGGVFCLALIQYKLVGLIAPTMLIFYGLALTAAAKFTLRDIYFIGILEILLGIFGLFNIGYGLVLWTIGFGLLHIIYGTLMWVKYE